MWQKIEERIDVEVFWNTLCEILEISTSTSAWEVLELIRELKLSHDKAHSALHDVLLNLEECKELIKWAFMTKGAKKERRSHGK